MFNPVFIIMKSPSLHVEQAVLQWSNVKLTGRDLRLSIDNVAAQSRLR
jgi:hypothetical protein